MIRLFFFILIFFYQTPNLIAQQFTLKSNIDSNIIFKVVDSSSFCFGKEINDVKEGPWIFNKSGKIEKIYTYQANKLNGICTIFYENGYIKMQLTFINDILNGDVNFYSHDGRLLATYEYINDVLGTIKFLLIDKESPPRNHDFYPEY